MSPTETERIARKIARLAPTQAMAVETVIDGLLNIAATRPEGDYLPISEICRRLDMSETTFWRLRKEHVIRGRKIGGKKRFRLDDVERCAETIRGEPCR